MTYMRLLQAVVMVVLLNGVMIGYNHWRGMNLLPEIELAKSKLAKLKEEHKQLEKAPILKKPAKVEGQYQDLFEALESYPKWAALVTEITREMPNSVWVNGIESATLIMSQASADLDDQKTLKDETDKAKIAQANRLRKPNKVRMNISGVAADVDALSQFIKNLELSPYFDRLILSESDRQEYGFNYLLISDVVKFDVE